MFITTLTGPFLKYRLDLIRKVAPSVKDYLIIFTDKFSYPFYHEHHDFFNFVFMDEYRAKNEFSMKYELFAKFTSEKDFLENFDDFYGEKTGVYYPWETHRFIFPYLIENEIKNFAIVDTDFIFCDDGAMLGSFFTKVPEGSFCMHSMGEDSVDRGQIWNEIQKRFTEIKLSSDQPLLDCDGYFRGFHFKTFEDMSLFYDIWNETIQYPIKNKDTHPHMLYHTDWIVPTLMQFFKENRNYSFYSLYDLIIMEGCKCRDLGRHYTRVEDTIYVGPRGGWEIYGFDYSDTTSIANFIKNNKRELINYYAPFDVELTESHVYTKLRQN